jgi:hypothetical protein
MLTSERRHYHKRANDRLAWKRRTNSYCREIGWGNVPGLGKWYKRQLHKARRRYIRAELRGHRGKSPASWESEVNWRGT